VHPQEEFDSGYLSYMLRMWRRRDSNGERVWCASLEEPGSRHTESFGEIGALFAFLQRRLGLEIDAEKARNEENQGGVSHE
jgi:hypothetical protein